MEIARVPSGGNPPLGMQTSLFELTAQFSFAPDTTFAQAATTTVATAQKIGGMQAAKAVTDSQKKASADYLKDLEVTMNRAVEIHSGSNQNRIALQEQVHWRPLELVDGLLPIGQSKVEGEAVLVAHPGRVASSELLGNRPNCWATGNHWAKPFAHRETPQRRS